MNDTKTQSQLVTGFYAVEAGTWRWTAGKFAVVLRPPTGADSRGAILKLSLSVPETVIHDLNEFTLSCKVGDTALPPQSFNHSGDYVYSQDVPASALRGDTVRVDFSLDKAIPPSQTDHRELGLVAKQISLTAK